MTASSGASPVVSGYRIHSQYPPLPSLNFSLSSLLLISTLPFPLLPLPWNPPVQYARTCLQSSPSGSLLVAFVSLLLFRHILPLPVRPQLALLGLVHPKPPALGPWRNLVNSSSPGPNSVQSATLAPIAATSARPHRSAIRHLSPRPFALASTGTSAKPCISPPLRYRESLSGQIRNSPLRCMLASTTSCRVLPGLKSC